MTFSEKLVEARRKTGLTQKEISEKLGMPKRTLESWEEGHRTPPDWLQLLVLDAVKKLKKTD